MPEKILPMLAKPLPEGFDPFGKSYCAEEKFDGHRLVVRVTDHLHFESWSRTGKDSLRKLSPEMQKALLQLPNGVYDGELVEQGTRSRSYGVSTLTNKGRLIYRVFDMLEGVMGTGSMITRPYHERRAALMFCTQSNPPSSPLVIVAESYRIPTRAALDELADRIWRENGEGIIVKDMSAVYSPGKRTNAFYKLKKWQITDTEELPPLTLVGFEHGAGEIVQRGPYAVMLLTDRQGNCCKIKTRDNEMLDYFEKKAVATGTDQLTHPDLGRGVVIEFTDRTPDGGYLMPHFDRWEDE